MAEYVVKSIVAVLPLKAGSERYFYRNSVVSDETVTEAGIAHALEVGLIEEQAAPELEPAPESKPGEGEPPTPEGVRFASEKPTPDTKRAAAPKVPAN